jgi:transcriptional regulator with XRE-family HTH domain
MPSAAERSLPGPKSKIDHSNRLRTIQGQQRKRHLAGKTEFEHLKGENPEGFRAKYQNRGYVGLRIKQRRLDIGMSQAYLASYFGTSREWVSIVEAGKVDINAGDLAVIAKLLDISPDYFVDRFGWQSPRDDKYITEGLRDVYNDLMAFFFDLPPGFQRSMINMAKQLHEIIYPPKQVRQVAHSEVIVEQDPNFMRDAFQIAKERFPDAMAEYITEGGYDPDAEVQAEVTEETFTAPK